MFATVSPAVSHAAFRTIAGTVGTIIFAGACLLGATAPAQASDAPRAQTVSYSDLNVSSLKGREALEMRIKHAARNVCATGSKELRARDAEARCIRTAIANAESSLTTTIAAN